MGCLNAVPKELLKSDVPFYKIMIESKIWNRESHGLFDYDLKEVFEKKMDVKGNLFIYGTYVNIHALLPSVVFDEHDSKKLFTIAYKEGQYWIYHWKDFTTEEALKFPSDQLWISLKHLNSISMKNRFHPKYGYRIK